jgi:hypothetical protein
MFTARTVITIWNHSVIYGQACINAQSVTFTRDGNERNNKRAPVYVSDDFIICRFLGLAWVCGFWVMI